MNTTLDVAPNWEADVEPAQLDELRMAQTLAQDLPRQQAVLNRMRRTTTLAMMGISFDDVAPMVASE